MCSVIWDHLRENLSTIFIPNYQIAHNLRKEISSLGKYDMPCGIEGCPAMSEKSDEPKTSKYIRIDAVGPDRENK